MDVSIATYFLNLEKLECWRKIQTGKSSNKDESSCSRTSKSHVPKGLNFNVSYDTVKISQINMIHKCWSRSILKSKNETWKLLERKLFEHEFDYINLVSCCNIIVYGHFKQRCFAWNSCPGILFASSNRQLIASRVRWSLVTRCDHAGVCENF